MLPGIAAAAATEPDKLRAESEGRSPHERRADIQGLRALAVILVVLFHTGLPVQGGFVGVDLFFVISGFVITHLLWRELRSTGRLPLGTFYARRVRRLLPALALVLTAVTAASLVLQSPLGLQQLTAKTGAAASLFAANASLFTEGGGYFALSGDYNPLLHTWTLAVEEQFYILFPALLLVAWAAGRRLRIPTTAAAALSVGIVLVLSLLASVALAHSSGLPFGSPGRNASFAFYASPVRAWEFALGGLLAIGEPFITRLGRLTAIAAGVLGLTLVLFAALTLNATTPFPGSAAVIPDLGAVLLIGSGIIDTVGVTALLGWRPLTWIGDVSYGWYLWHWPVIVFTRTLWPDAPPAALFFAAVLALIPTWLSYQWVENPIRRSAAIVGWRAVALGTTCVLLPLSLNSTLWASTLFPSATVADLTLQARGHADDTHHCQANLPSDLRTASACTWTIPAAKGTVVLLGDSNAGQFAEMVAAAATSRGFNFTLATFGGCPFADVITEYSTVFDDQGCRKFVTTWLTYVGRSHPELVFLASASTEYLHPGNGVTFTSAASGIASATAAGKSALWEEGLRRALRRLDAANVPAVIIHTVPHFKSFDLRTCPGFRVLIAPSSCGKTVSRSSIERAGQLARTAEQRAVEGSRLAVGVDFTGAICTRTECSTNRNGRWIYRDGAHLSLEGAMLCRPQIVELIQTHAEHT